MQTEVARGVQACPKAYGRLELQQYKTKKSVGLVIRSECCMHRRRSADMISKAARDEFRWGANEIQS